MKLHSTTGSKENHIVLRSDRTTPFIMIKEAPSIAFRCNTIKNQLVNVGQECLPNGLVAITPISKDATNFFHNILQSEEFINFSLNDDFIVNFRSLDFIRSYDQYQDNIEALNTVL